jgi:hypothetical protein
MPTRVDMCFGLCAAVLAAIATAGPSASRAVAAAEATETAADSPSWLKRDKVLVGNAGDLPDGFVVYSLGQMQTNGKKSYIGHLPGVVRSPLREHKPALLPGTENDHEIAHLDISEDGDWLLFSSTPRPSTTPEQPMTGEGRRLIVCRVDGTAREEVPVTRDGAQSLLLSGFYRRSPLGPEIFYSRNPSTIVAVKLDSSEGRPRFGPQRILCAGIAWDNDDSMSVSGNHLHGRLGELSRYVTIPDGGRGVAGPDNLWRFAGKTKYGCAVTLSHDGALAVSNPTQLEKVDRYPAPGQTFPIWHRGFVVLPFKEDHEPPLDIADYYFQHAVSANWVMAAMRPGNHDYSQWHATNDREYVIGREISRKPDAFGCWMVHWPTNTWTRLTPPDKLALGPAAHFHRAPAGKGAAGASSAAPVSSVAPAAPPRIVVDGRLVRAYAVPTPNSIAPYRQALAMNVYQIDRVVDGQLDARRVVIGHWAVRDGRMCDGAERKEDATYRMALVPLASFSKLKSLPRSDMSDYPDLPVYVDADSQ